MSISGSIEISGFTIRYVVQMWSSGVVLSGDDHHSLNNPEYIEALQDALKMFPYFEMVCWKKNVMGTQHSESVFSNLNEQMTDDGIEYAEKARLCLDVMGFEWTQGAEYDNVLYTISQLEISASRCSLDKIPRPKAKIQGYVYLASDRSKNQLYKIGRSKNPAKRAKALGKSIEIVYSIGTDDTVNLERKLQYRFIARHVFGEWFHFNQHDLEFFPELAAELAGEL